MTNSDSGPDELRVVVFSKANHPDELAAVFQQELKLHPTDALIWARHVPGILTGTFPAGQAHALVAAITRIGGHGSAFPADQIPDLHHATVIHHMRCTDDGLRLMQANGEPGGLIPWAAIQVVCVGEVPIDVNRHYSSGNWTAVSAGHHYQSGGVVAPGTPALEAWIVCQPPLPAICIDHGHMNYEYLGSRRVDSAACNFHSFITDVIKSATGARLTESTNAYLSHIQPETYRFPSREDLIRHVTLQTLLARESQSAVPPPSPPIDALSLGTP